MLTAKIVRTINAQTISGAIRNRKQQLDEIEWALANLSDYITDREYLDLYRIADGIKIELADLWKWRKLCKGNS